MFLPVRAVIESHLKTIDLDVKYMCIKKTLKKKQLATDLTKRGAAE